jgi:8-oxo-dGTP pyrophosphatase MutT (NUDIX family)
VAADRPRIRPSVRALLVDADGCVLLHEWLRPSGMLWSTPGGGLEPGESDLDALRRELLEEVGLELDHEPPLVWRRDLVGPDLATGYDGVSEKYWLIRCEHFEPVGQLGVEALLAEDMGPCRWWSVDELAAATGELFAPRALAQLLRDLLEAGPPSEPLALGL